jgi:hypothetical protein
VLHKRIANELREVFNGVHSEILAFVRIDRQTEVATVLEAKDLPPIVPRGGNEPPRACGQGYTPVLTPKAGAA